jgi:metallophosphoesterase superfamily enzyme
MSSHQYERKHVKVHQELRMGPFLFTHHPVEEADPTHYNLAGHIHPGVNLRGGGRQSVTLPCFYFGEKRGLLPAFGMFTGIARIIPEKGDQIFVVADEKVIPVS